MRLVTTARAGQKSPSLLLTPDTSEKVASGRKNSVSRSLADRAPGCGRCHGSSPAGVTERRVGDATERRAPAVFEALAIAPDSAGPGRTRIDRCGTATSIAESERAQIGSSAPAWASLTGAKGSSPNLVAIGHPSRAASRATIATPRRKIAPMPIDASCLGLRRCAPS